MRFTLDSNILIYAVDNRDPEKRAIAAPIVQRAALADAILTAQALGEFLSVVRRKMPEALPSAIQQAQYWTTLFPVVPTTESSPFEALLLAERHRLQFWDALILSVAQRAGAKVILSEDMADGQDMGGTSVLNPFNRRNAADLERLLEPTNA